MTRRILVPTDGSPKAEAGLEHALVTYPEAAITVLHVMTPYDAWGADAPPLPEGLADEWYDEARERAASILEAAREQAAAHGMTVETEMQVGEPWRTIVDYAEEKGIDHVVMGSHGRPDGEALPLGSVAEAVMRRAPVLVSIVR